MADNYWKLYDRRTMDRYVEKGMLKGPEAQSYLKSLPDETNNAQWVQMDINDTEMGNENDKSAEDTTPEVT